MISLVCKTYLFDTSCLPSRVDMYIWSRWGVPRTSLHFYKIVVHSVSLFGLKSTRIKAFIHVASQNNLYTNLHPTRPNLAYSGEQLHQMRCMKQPCIAQRRPHLLPGAPRASLVDFGSKTRTVRQKWCPWRSWQQTRSTLGNAGLFHTPLMVELFPKICVCGGSPKNFEKNFR